ncbi:MAG TPA: endolytic transglycosylase MltG [Melioribacteraceae bacterium]|nr:endolytic transglycosylase MltG [Melioribacteraceae bacterium]
MNNSFKNILKSVFSRKEMIYIVSFFFFVLGLLVFTFFFPNYHDLKEPVLVEVKKGQTLSQISDTLYQRKIIPSKINMKIAAIIYGAERKIKAGRYVIPNGLSYLQLVELLIEGSPDPEVLITIGEGIWQMDLAKLLKENFGIDSSSVIELSRSKSFLNSLGIYADNLEGYLLPETYFFYAHSAPEEILRKLASEMDKIFSDNKVIARMKELNMDKHKILTMASIIDAESNLFSEFKTISGVYHNRLKKGMLLQADPTVQYLIRDRRKNKIYFKDLEIDSKYNTYKYAGLPPSPINNPGKDAIYAALYPENHKYLYFVANGQGGHYFSTNMNDHSVNVSRYRQWRASQK